MALNNLGLGFVFTAQDRATGTISRVGSTFDATGQKVRQSSGMMRAAMFGVGAGIATMAAGIGTLMATFGLAARAGEFGQTIARVGALTRASETDLARLRDRAIEAGIATQFSPREAAEGLAELGVRGLNANEAMAALSGSLDLAAGGQISVAQSSSTLAAALRVFRISADDAGLATDQLLRISNVTALQAGDLELALGNVSRGAGVAQQSIEEMLPAIGLVKNTGVEASSAATGVSTALIRMAQSAPAFRRIGVEVTDAQGNFRPFLDVVRETDIALRERFPNAAERATSAVELFGVRGLGAFQAVASQLNGQIRDTEGNVLDSAAAIDFLRESMTGAAGAAAEFRERMLDTFEGQQTLLRGTIETLQTVTGESFGRVFRPFVESITNVLNIFIQVWQAIPAPLQTAIAGIVVALGGLLTAFGGAATAGFLLVLIIPFLKAIAIAMLVLGVALAPVIVGIAAVAAGVAALGIAARLNIGGFGDFVTTAFNRVKLAFQGLIQLFSEGGFSGEVREEMNRAENQGIRAFVINIFAIGFRIKEFFAGIVQGVQDFMEANQPAIDALMEAFTQLGEALGFVSEGIGELAGTDSADAFAEGHEFGQLFGEVLIFIVDMIRNLVQFFTGFVENMRAGFKRIEPVIDRLGEAFGAVGDAMTLLIGSTAEMGAAGRDGESGAMNMGRAFADFLVPAIEVALLAFIIFLEIIVFVIRAVVFFQKVWDVAGDAISLAVGVMIEAFESMFGAVSDVVSITTSALRLLGILSIGEPTTPAEADAREERRTIARSKASRDRSELARTRIAGLGPTQEPLAAVAAAARPTGATAADFREALTGLGREIGRRPVEVTSVLTIDGEVLARATERGRRGTDAGAFRPPVLLGPED